MGLKEQCGTCWSGGHCRRFLSHAGLFMVLLLYTGLGAKIFEILEHPLEKQRYLDNWRSLHASREQFIDLVIDAIVDADWRQPQGFRYSEDINPNPEVIQKEMQEGGSERKETRLLKIGGAELDTGGTYKPMAKLMKKVEETRVQLQWRRKREDTQLGLLRRFDAGDEQGNIETSQDGEARASRDQVRNLLVPHLGEYEVALEDGLSKGVTPGSKEELSTEANAWQFGQSLFFAATVLTTIGYGNIAPSSTGGRLFCIAFAMVGIPLTLCVLANLGELLASGLALLPLEKLSALMPRTKRRSIFLVLGSFSLFIIYLSLGAGLFMAFEAWTFMESFYFCFITMTTIGFGDLVPEESPFVLSTTYIMVGLAITSTMIELVRRQYVSSWERMKALSGRLQELSAPLALAVKKLAETGAGQIEMDAELFRELRDLNHALATAGADDGAAKDTENVAEEDPWDQLLDLALRKKKITIVMYETSL